MFWVRLVSLVWLFLNSATGVIAESYPSLIIPHAGDTEIRCLTPSLVEISLITTKNPDPAPVKQWPFADLNGKPSLPTPKQFVVTIDGKPASVVAVGFKRRVLYAPLKRRDLRIANDLYLKLATTIKDNQKVEVSNPDEHLWENKKPFSTVFSSLRWSPAIHVNQTGYQTSSPKTAMVGYYLGNLGEMDLNFLTDLIPSSTNGAAATTPTFSLKDAHTSKSVFEGRLTRRPDRGFPFSSYQAVWEANFSEYKVPGEYQLFVPGLGTSFPFSISDGAAAAFARAYALGLYHQRCGTSNALPFTRFTDGTCHTALVDIPFPQSAFKTTWEILADKTTDVKENARHTAPRMKGEKSQLYPFIKRGKLDVSGGHHDAGDYSKYTINSAALIHHLILAADAFPGVAALDNLGIPESGDGRSDILQEAKWEADFLAKMQDDDGGFFFLVYPREREYENDVTPDHGDPQVVWPKTTSVTAAAVAALAQCASSPTFKKQFPEAAAAYMVKAKAGWNFLQRGIAKYGKDGAYQKITHYGNEFMHDDELAWAAVEMFLATGDSAYEKLIGEWFHPASEETRKWGWWRLYEAYGCATRSYAFAAKSGRIKRERLDPALLSKCEEELIAAAQDQLDRAEESAYGTSLPKETKQSRSAGWYFSGDAAFDLAVACQLDFPVMNDPRPKFMRAIWSNLNYEQGCNPINVCYLTGMGWMRQHEIVDQYAQNSRRILPPTGIPLGNIQDGFGWLDNYKKELGELSFPTDGDQVAPFPFYDRWGDSFNLNQEFVIVNQARSLAYLAWLMAQSPLKDQPWKFASATITGIPQRIASGERLILKLQAPGIDLENAQIVWEASDHAPTFGQTFTFSPNKAGPHWIEAEAQLPDGRRVFATTNCTVK
ncbi:glycoside hydrolase family 9 protein [Pedosphaera parvula]|uniref:Glycoside hydrolase family 9 n=1 Tax=Pedosphaera parvula (strain Ellin514) TaxID=320771 RepID=B9X9T6_PEDPL|nr:glycoside hydrolase family 9 protein [Pedosphaera parvula]EEF63237.1 glycoside hydrolase family 9 [Pedosphaera parvula Ellin514]